MASEKPLGEKRGRGRPKGSKKAVDSVTQQRGETMNTIADQLNDVDAKRGRGRPKNSKNQTDSRAEELNLAMDTTNESSDLGSKRGRGRPKGSQNKITLSNAASHAAEIESGSEPAMVKAPGDPQETIAVEPALETQNPVLRDATFYDLFPAECYSSLKRKEVPRTCTKMTMFNKFPNEIQAMIW